MGACIGLTHHANLFLVVVKVCFSEHNNRKTFIKCLYISQCGSFNFHRVCSLFRSALSGRAQTSEMIDLDGNRCRNWRGKCREEDVFRLTAGCDATEITYEPLTST